MLLLRETERERAREHRRLHTHRETGRERERVTEAQEPKSLNSTAQHYTTLHYLQKRHEKKSTIKINPIDRQPPLRRRRRRRRFVSSVARSLVRPSLVWFCWLLLLLINFCDFRARPAKNNTETKLHNYNARSVKGRKQIFRCRRRQQQLGVGVVTLTIK